MEFSVENYGLVLRNDFASFVKKCFWYLEGGKELKWNWHLDYLCDVLEGVERGERKRLIVNIPPRCLKSTIATIAFPAWVMGRKPSERVIAISYSHNLSTEHSVKCRRIMESDWYREVFPAVEMSDDQNRKDFFQTTEGGHRIATSVGGSLTGSGGNYLILDDPMSTGIAASDTERGASNDWVRGTVFSRLDDKDNGRILVIMQRLHEMDTTGMFDAAGGWEKVVIPAMNDGGRREFKWRWGSKVWGAGELLHPTDLTKEYLDGLKKEIDSYNFAGQYMQSPAPRDGAIFKREWFKRYEGNKGYKEIVQSWDTAYKGGEYNDPSVCTTWGLREDGYYLLDVWKERADYPTLKKKVRELAVEWNADYVLIEDRASGQSLIQDLRWEMRRSPLIAITPVTDKVSRAIACTRSFEAGLVRLPERGSWLSEYESELLQFPRARHDDCVDSTSQFLNWIKRDYLDYIKEKDKFDEIDVDFEDDVDYSGRNPTTGY